MLTKERIPTLTNVVTGALIGGILGVAIALLLNYEIIAGAALGIIIGGGVGSLAGRGIAEHSPVSEQVVYKKDHKATLELKQEQLDISKKQIQTGDVTLHKEFVNEEKTVIVPVTREELVIEKKVFDKKDPSKAAEHSETIRIPISEERVEVSKHPIFLNDVSVYKHQFQDIEHLNEIVKKEEVHLETSGSPKISNKNP